MSKKDYIPVGEIMTRKNGKKYEAVISISKCCSGCAFKDRAFEYCEPILCCSSERADGLNVSFLRRKDLEV